MLSVKLFDYLATLPPEDRKAIMIISICWLQQFRPDEYKLLKELKESGKLHAKLMSREEFYRKLEVL